jgi:hypothetical protein
MPEDGRSMVAAVVMAHFEDLFPIAERLVASWS